MGRPVRPVNLAQQQRTASREQRRLKVQVRRLEAQVEQQRPYRATPNTEVVDPEVVTQVNLTP